MRYVFDTSSLRGLQHINPDTFSSFWVEFDALVANGTVVSVREVQREIDLQARKPWFIKWIKAHKAMFKKPTARESRTVQRILAVPLFRTVIGKNQQLNGWPVADPFVIAHAITAQCCVVTEEALKPNSSKIPNVCQHFKVDCINLEEFQRQQGWSF